MTKEWVAPVVFSLHDRIRYPQRTNNHCYKVVSHYRELKGNIELQCWDTKHILNFPLISSMLKFDTSFLQARQLHGRLKIFQLLIGGGRVAA